jgi:pimeloyl-ACP methyl ester carboxylesterase
MNRTLLHLGATLGLLAGPANADTFVLVHGAFQTSESWAPVAQGLQGFRAQGCRRQPAGRGNDAGTPGDVIMDDHVAAVTAAIDASGPDKVILVGHSFGGMVISR